MSAFPRRLGRLAGVFAGLLLIGLAALHLPPVRSRVLDWARGYAERELGVVLRASSLRYNVFSRSIELQNVVLAPPASISAGEPFVHAARVSIAFGPGIFVGRPAIERVALIEPRLTLVRNADGTLNLPPSRDGAASTSPLHFGIVSVTRLSIHLEDRVAQRAVTLGPLDLSLDTAGTATRPGSFGPAAFTMRAGSMDLSGTVAGKLAFDGTRVRADPLTIETNAGRLALSGWADVTGERPAISSRLDATIELQPAARLASVNASGLAGRLEASVDISGDANEPVVAVAIAGRDVAYAPIGGLQVNGRSTVRGSRVAIQTLDVTSAVGSVHMEGDVALSDTPSSPSAAPPSRVALRWSDVRVDDLANAFGYSTPIRAGSRAGGSAGVDFATRNGAIEWSQVHAQASTTFAPLEKPSGTDTLGLAGRIDLQLEQRRWSLKPALDAARVGADLAGDLNGFLDEQEFASTLGGRSRLRVADVATLLPLVEASGVKLPSTGLEDLAGSATATVDLAGTIAKPRADIDLAIRDLRARMMPQALTIDARLHADTNAMRVDQLRAASRAASLEASGQYTWSRSFEARFAADAAELSDLAAQFASPVSLGGSGRVEGTISGAGQAGKAVVALSATALTVEQVDVGRLIANATVNLADGSITTVDAAALDLGARAQLEILNRDRYPVSGVVSLEHDEVGALVPPSYRSQIGELSGKVSATARGSGYLSDPTGIRGRVDVRALDLVARGVRVALAAPAAITATGDRVAVESIDLRVGEATRATVDGQLGTNAVPQSMRVRVDGPLSDLVAIGSRAAGMESPLALGDGTATIDVTIGGTLGHPLPSGTVAVRSQSLQYAGLAPVTNVTVDAALDPTLISLRTFAARWQGASVAGDGVVPWRVLLNGMAPAPSSRLSEWLNALPAEPARATLTLRASDVGPDVLKDVLAPERLEQIQGNVSITASLEADRPSLDAISGTAVLDRAWVVVAGVPFDQDLPTRIRLRGGRASIDAFEWSAEGNIIGATGGADFSASPPSLDLGVRGALDLRVLSAFVTGLAAGGTTQADLKITGALDKPEIVGGLTVADGYLEVDNPRVAAADLNGTIRIAADRKATVSLDALVNTGNAKLTGTIDVQDPSAPVGTLRFTGRGVALEYPPGLQTESNADLELALAGARSTLSGRVEVLGGTYREPLVLSSQLMNFASTAAPGLTEQSDGWLSRLRIDVAVATATDVHVDNNYGRLDLGATLRVVGTAASPGVLGRLQAAEDGEIYLGGNTYRIERLAIDLTNPRAIEPDVVFSAQTRIGDLPIGVEFRCPAAGACERKVTSLAPNVDDKEAEARLFGTAGGAASAGENLARLLSGELLGVVGRTVGLDAVRLEQGAARRDIFDDPTLISGDVNPAARLTLAKRIGSDVELVFSQNLADEGFTWITSYTGAYGLSWRLLVLDDQSRSYEFRHEPPIGAGRSRRPAPPPAPRIVAVRIAGATGFSENEVRRQLRLTENDRFTFRRFQEDRDRLARFYRGQGFLEARVRARQSSTDSGIQIEYTITRGPATKLVVNGATLPDAVRDRILGRWASALFDGFLERDARAIVREHFFRAGHLNATVTAAVTANAARDVKTLTLDVSPGASVPSRVEFKGNTALTTDRLLAVVDAGGANAAWLEPRVVERALESLYRSEGFLAADVAVGSPTVVNGTSVVSIEVAEGATYSVGRIELRGLPDISEQDARDALAVRSGEPYRPATVAAAVGRLEARLRQAAYLESTVDVQTAVDAINARVDIGIQVTPGRRSILRDVVVQGGDAGKPPVAKAIVLKPDAPLDPAAVSQTRQRLYELDVYRSVDIDVQPVARGDGASAADATGDQPVVARIDLEERPRYRLRYGLAVSDEEVSADNRDQRLGFAADLENRNIFGRGANVGFSVRLRRDQQVGRVTVGANRLFGLPIRSTIFTERKREQQNTEGAFPITSDVTDVTGEQAYRVARAFEWRYGYGIERNRTFIRSDGADPFDLTVTIARFTTSGLLDRRDDVFNPTRGWFASSALELSRPGLGSDLSFLKDFAQYMHFAPFGRRVVLASAARLGLARTFEHEELIPSERFYAGGANTVRGYREDDLGERSILGDAAGGSALLVLNGELRFPVYRWLKGAGFLDAGNVYPNVSDISLSTLRFGFGAGARLDTPFGLVRFDFGVPANRRSFDPRWRLHIGLGQAF